MFALGLPLVFLISGRGCLVLACGFRRAPVEHYETIDEGLCRTHNGEAVPQRNEFPCAHRRQMKENCRDAKSTDQSYGARKGGE